MSILLLALLHEGKGVTMFACSACTANTMNIVFVGCWLIKIDHVTYVWYIKASSCYVSSYQNLNIAISK